MNVKFLPRMSAIGAAAGLALALGVAGCDTMGGMSGGDNQRSGTMSSRDTGAMTESRADASITERVRSRLVEAHSDSVRMDNVRVTTDNGTVTLSGYTSSPHEKARATQIAQSVSGVREVHNNIAVRAP